MVLTAKEESLINAVRSLPSAETDRMLTWAHQLLDLANGRQLEWADSWSDEDLKDATVDALRRLDRQETESR
ncbi:MAG: hypothetical protein ABI824_05655 [Acidobacteriota bacterium]